MAPERRHSLRQKVNTPAFASFDGVTGGMILDLSEEGMAMKSLAPLVAHSILPLHLSLGEPDTDARSLVQRLPDDVTAVLVGPAEAAVAAWSDAGALGPEASPGRHPAIRVGLIR